MAAWSVALLAANLERMMVARLVEGWELIRVVRMAPSLVEWMVALWVVELVMSKAARLVDLMEKK